MVGLHQGDECSGGQSHLAQDNAHHPTSGCTSHHSPTSTALGLCSSRCRGASRRSRRGRWAVRGPESVSPVTERGPHAADLDGPPAPRLRKCSPHAVPLASFSRTPPRRRRSSSCPAHARTCNPNGRARGLPTIRHTGHGGDRRRSDGSYTPAQDHPVATVILVADSRPGLRPPREEDHRPRSQKGLRIFR